MSVSGHHSTSPARVPCFVLTVSDTRTPDRDTSGQAIADLLQAAGHHLVGRALVRDEPDQVVGRIRQTFEAGTARAVITTGGTGMARRDTTVDAVTALFDRTIPGFGELFRMLSFEDIGAAAMLSRATAGIARGHAVFVLPGSEAAVRLAMTRLILPELGHIIRELSR